MNSPKILRDTLFNVDINGNGGNRRTAQIDEILSSTGYEIYDITYKTHRVSTTLFSRYIQGINLLFKHQIKMLLDRKMIKQGGDVYQKYKEVFQKNSESKILLWEATRDWNYIVPYVAKDMGLKIIALPHNIESLSVANLDPFTQEKLPDSLVNEFKHLSVADAIFCISREEKWLLNLFGIEADYLPYYPPKLILENLLQIRQQRHSTKQQGQRFLIIGSIDNPPTRLGIIELINKLRKLHKQIDFKIDLAGYKTEQIKEYCDDDFITFHGTIIPEKLNDLLLIVSGVLIYQKTGVGALTKIPEMLIAGIPVIANGNASRSAFDYSGLHCYENDDELADLLSKKLDQPDIISYPEQAVKRLINCFNNMLL